MMTMMMLLFHHHKFLHYIYEQIVEDNEGTDKKLMEKVEAENTTNQTHHEPITEDEEVNMRMVNAKIGRENNDDVGRLSEVASSQSSQQQSERSAPTLSASSGHHQQSTEIIRRPPPPSMLVDPHGDDDVEGAVTNSAAAPQTDNSAGSPKIIEATLVPDVPDAPVHDATPIQETETRWWKRNKKLLVFILLDSIVGIVFCALFFTGNLGSFYEKVLVSFIPQTNAETSITQQINATTEVSCIFVTV